MDRDATLDDFVGRGSVEDGVHSADAENEAVEKEAAENDTAEDTADAEDDAARDATDGTVGEGVATDDRAAVVDDSGAAPGPTSTWRPDGAACQSCGATVERRWRGAAGLVCGGCKEW